MVPGFADAGLGYEEIRFDIEVQQFSAQFPVDTERTLASQLAR